MKPGDHREFFRLAAPEGRSRESTIRLDGEGRFFHDGEPVEHPKLRDAMHTWIGRHPDDGRYILTNGYDWCYFAVDDVPYFVRSLRDENGDATLVLSDGTEEVLDPPSVTANARGELYTTVKAFQAGAENRPFAAKFSRFAQGQLGPFLESTSEPGAELDRETVSLVTKRGRTKLAI